MYIIYIQCILHKHIHECAQAIKLRCLSRNIFLPLFEDFCIPRIEFSFNQAIKNIKDKTLEDNVTKKVDRIKNELPSLCFHTFLYFFSCILF